MDLFGAQRGKHPVVVRLAACLVFCLAGSAFSAMRLTGDNPAWPDLSRPAPYIGGGEADAAVIVGIEKYSGGLPVLAGAAANAWAWFDYFNKTRGVPGRNISLLLDAEATAGNMAEAVSRAAAQAGAGGALWFVFIGHGLPDAAGRDRLLAGVDAKNSAAAVRGRSLPLKALLSSLSGASAGVIVVLLDAYFSGKGPDGKALVAGLAPFSMPIQLSDQRFAVLTAAGPEEAARPLPGAERPAFSYLALGGLRGWAGSGAEGGLSAGVLGEFISKSFTDFEGGKTRTPELSGNRKAVLARRGTEKGPDMERMGKIAGTVVNTGLSFQPEQAEAVPEPASPPAMSAPSGRRPEEPGRITARSPSVSGAGSEAGLEAVIKFDESQAGPGAKAEKWREFGLSFPRYAEFANKRAVEWFSYAAWKAFEKTAAWEAGLAAPSEKASAWRSLSAKYPQYAVEAGPRADEWERYGAALAAAEKARALRARLQESDWNKLSRILASSGPAAEIKIKAAAAFIGAYGTKAENNPYLVYLLPVLGMELIPAGGFLMGSPETEGGADEYPRHEVYLNAFCMDKYEVTAAKYGEFAAAAGRKMPPQETWSTEEHPVVNVDWNDASAYCAWAGKRLPSEAEWEKAARGGAVTRYSYGDDEKKLDEFAWHPGNSGGQAHPAGGKKPNQYGLYDMAGNVWEWAADRYDAKYYAASPPENPAGPDSGTLRVRRGGSWNFFDISPRPAARGSDSPGVRSPSGGFRCVY